MIKHQISKRWWDKRGARGDTQIKIANKNPENQFEVVLFRSPIRLRVLMSVYML
jgi:hypothetical protein